MPRKEVSFPPIIGFFSKIQTDDTMPSPTAATLPTTLPTPPPPPPSGPPPPPPAYRLPAHDNMPVATVAAVVAVAGDESCDDIVVAQANFLEIPMYNEFM